MRTYNSRMIATLCVAVILISCGSATEGTTDQAAEATSVEESSHPMGQASVEDDVSAKNILQVAMGSDAHTTLVAAVQAASIENVLVNAGPLTVFAPTNDAFSALPAGTVEGLLKPENKASLANILTGHAAPGSYDQEGLRKESKKGRKVYMANGSYVDVTVDGEDIYVGGAKVIGTIMTSNGVINVVDKVILPE